jgi:hypothetical protein
MVILLGPVRILTATTRIFVNNTTIVDRDNVNTFSPASAYFRTSKPYSSINSTLYDSCDLSITAAEFECRTATGSSKHWHAEFRSPNYT